MKQKVIEVIGRYIDCDFYLEKPKEITLGHYATPVAFSLAKEKRCSPMLIAKELAQKLAKEEIFEDVSAINGYINFKLKEEFMDEYISWAICNEELFAKGKDKNRSILVEYVSANPTGPLHIGHARGAVIGNSLCRIGAHLGYKTVSEYYINDLGNQVELLGLSIFLRGKEQVLHEETIFPEEFYRGEYIIDIAQNAAIIFGKDIFNDKTNIPTLTEFGKNSMLENIKETLSNTNISFDNFVSEKSLYPKWEQSYKKLQDSGNTYKKDDKIWLQSSSCGDEKDRVIIREDKRATYLAGDIVYHEDKYMRKYDHYINIWGADHHGYIARMKAAINFLGYDEGKLEVILTQMVSLVRGGEPYKMGKRSGNFILMSDVLEEIGNDALRFIFLSKKSDTHLEFDIDTLKQNDSSNPIYYINYAHARINQLFEKSGKNIEEIKNVKLVGLNESATNLLFNTLLLPEVIEDAFEQRQLQKVTDYLRFLAGLLHKFYNENRVVGTEHEERYLKLLYFTALCLRVGLKLIGISAKSKM